MLCYVKGIHSLWLGSDGFISGKALKILIPKNSKSLINRAKKGKIRAKY